MTDTNNTDGAALLPVTQSDRDAAAGLVAWHNRVASEWKVDGGNDLTFFAANMPDAIREGAWDNHDVIQAFARHRTATQEDAERSVATTSERVCSACDGESKGCTGEYRCLRCEGSGVEPDFVGGLDNRTLSTPTMSDRQEYDGEAVREALSELWGIVHGCDLRLSVPMETIHKVRAALAHPEQARDEMTAQTVDEVDRLLALIETANEHGDEMAIVEQAAKVRASLSSDKGEEGEASRG